MSIVERRTAIERAISPAEVRAANELARRWFASRPRPPAAAAGLGVWPLLTTLATGASGETRDELLDAAGIGPDRADSITGALLAAARTVPSIRLALGVWAGSEIALDPDWIAKLPANAIGTLTGEPDADKATLDLWASEETDGMIERMPLDLTQRIDLVLASALMVRTKWVTEFRDAAVPFRSGPWAGLGPCRVLSNTIHDDVLRVSEEAAVLTVPGHDGIDVLLGLGRDGLAPGEVMSTLFEAAGDRAWGRSSADMAVGEEAPGVTVSESRSSKPQTTPEVNVRTVRFSVSADLDLSEDAAALGLEYACDEDRAEFDRLAAEPTYVSQARQRCVAAFSATGFEAAAVTAMAMARMGGVAMKTVHWHREASIDFDRPFAYLARHRPSGLILVGGWVDEPERAV
ncbi:serpin family protein [Glycomyces arizonensis]|uniref:serpin family protein n=1 Tax=Glycomyces arizonensis TaxID=256035 RepID=UPI000684E32A|nr:serpin family protein [Glycomyces arizonensis]